MIFRFLIVFQLFIFSLLASENSNETDSPIAMANLEGEPSAFVHQCVNVISGQFCDSQIDLIAYHGVNPLMVERSHFGTTAQTGMLGPGWTINHSSKLKQVPKKFGKTKIKDYGITVEEDNGCHFDFPRAICKSASKSISMECLKRGVTNTSTGYISGQTNLKNLKISIPGSDIYCIETGEGAKKEYLRAPDKDSNGLLLREIKPNGNTIKYIYLAKIPGNLPLKVELLNSAQKITNELQYYSINPDKINKKHAEHTITTPDGRYVKYIFGKHDHGKYLLERVERSDRPVEDYKYWWNDKEFGPITSISRRIRPDGRYLKADCYMLGDNKLLGTNVHIKEGDDPRLYRVKELVAPAGANGEPVPIYHFIYSYKLNENKKDPVRTLSGCCNVYNAFNVLTRYSFDDNQRLLFIEKYDKNEKKYSRENLYWGAEKSPEETQLIARTLSQADGTLTFARTYAYDSRGNVLQDCLYGNLSGQNKQAPIINKNGIVVSKGCECYIKKNVYSDDGLNLLLEEDDGFQKTAYRYEPGTNLLIAKFKGDGSTWQQRWFFAYNEDGAVTQEIVDDGSSENKDDLTNVTERYITNYTQSNSYPVAYPIAIEEKCLHLVTGQEQLIRKITNKYNNLAKITQQDHFDSENTFTHSLFWEYDRMGNVTKETDALGREIIRKYDDNGNCIFEQGHDPNVHKVFTYDKMDRLIKEEEVHADGITLSLSHSYDIASNKVSTTDFYGNTINFQHDPYGRVISTTLPKVLDENGLSVRPKTFKEYDVMGNVILERDARNIAIKRSYTIRGEIELTTYPDGTTESKSYQLNGVLKETKAKNGVITRYTNDSFGRPTKTEIISPNGELICSTSATYNAFHILTETDAMGMTTVYDYYPNGKLKSRKKGQQRTTYSYDNNGRLSSTIEWYNEHEYILKIKAYDLIGRVIQEHVEDHTGCVLAKLEYDYDIVGNLIKTTREQHNGPSISTTQYDSHGTPVLATDAEGNQTITRCRYDYKNYLRQFVPYQEVTDPLGNTSTIEKDALGRNFIVQRKNAFGTILQKQENRYDLSGNHRIICDTIFDKETSRKVLTHMLYDSSNRLTDCYEAFGSPEQKSTKVTYNQYGQKQDLIKNDGVRISHIYDHLGRLDKLSSSDGTVHYTYHYDLNGNVLQVEDRTHGLSTDKSYDCFNQMTKEKLGNELTLEYTYDDIDRPLSVILPDMSSINYTYKGTLLTSVARLDQNNAIIYEHIYNDYDLSGHLLQATLPGRAGTLVYQYDYLGRIKHIAAPYWQENQFQYDAVGNLLSRQLKDNLGEIQASFKYDDLYQLVEEEGAISHKYSYDSHYNRLDKNGRTHRYNQLHQLLDDGIYRYDYDHNGNMISKDNDTEKWTYAYDALDRLVNIQSGNQKIEYVYDENHRRLTKTLYTQNDEDWSQTKEEYFLYQGQNEIGSCNSQGIIQELRLLGNSKGAEIGAAVAIEIGDKVYVPVHDHNGNVSSILDLDGQVVETYRYTAYGEELFDTAMIPWRFSSKRVDEETGFVYFGRRYYDPAVGRWVTPDPIGREGGPNLYAYVLNNPLSHIDLYGLFETSFGDSLGALFEKAVGFVATLLKLPGNFIEFAGKHFVPIPYVKDVIQFGGWCLAGNSPGTYKPSWQEHCKVMRHEGYGNPDPHMRHVTYNGICCSENEMQARMAKLSSDYGGVDVTGIYNASNGFVLDLLEVMCQKIGIPTPAQASAEYETARLAREMGPHGTFIVDAHSQGCETVHNLSPCLKKMMNVNTYGAARVLEPQQYISVRNYMSSCDFVTPIADPWGFVKGLSNGNISFLSPRGCPALNHCFEGKTYQGQLMQNGAAYKSIWGSVE